MATSIVFVTALFVGLGLSGCAVISPPAEGGLQLEEHPLNGPPNAESGVFEPLHGTQEDILAVHASDRAERFSSEVILVQGEPGIWSLGERQDLLAVIETAAQGEPRQTARLMRGDTLLFEVDAGLPSPALPLQGLWTYGDHWALEVLFSDPDNWVGRLYIDGELVNEQEGYEEAFGFQLLGGRPFFFYQREGSVGYSFDGRETDLGYDEVPHYRCCSESSLNPLQAENMVAFFALRDQVWHYVELGDF